MSLFKRLICILLCIALLICVASCGNKGTSSDFSPVTDAEKQEDDMPQDMTESEESYPFEYEEEPVSSSNNYDEAEKDILDKQPSASSKDTAGSNDNSGKKPSFIIGNGNKGDKPNKNENPVTSEVPTTSENSTTSEPNSVEPNTSENSTTSEPATNENPTTSTAPNTNENPTTSEPDTIEPGTIEPNTSEAPTASEAPNINNEPSDEGLDFGGEVITLMHAWEPYKSANYWDNTLTQKIPEAENKYHVKINQQQAKISFAAEMLAGTVPKGHVYAIGSDSNSGIYDLLRKGYVSDLSGAIAETGVDITASHYDPFNTGIFNINGKQWALGFGHTRIGAAVLYHAKLTKSLGYDIPNLIENNQWTWSKMTEIARKATVRGVSGEVEQWGIGIGNTGIKGLILSNNGHFVHPNANGQFASSLNSDNTKQALKQVYDWCNTDRVATFFADGVWSSGNTAFAMGNVAMYFADEGAILAVADKVSKEDFGIAYLPMGPANTKYVSYVSNSYCYIVPSYYNQISSKLVLLMDRLFSTATIETQTGYLDSVWKNRFASEKDYSVFKKLHFDTNIERAWEGSDYINWQEYDGLGFESLANGSVVPDAFVETNHELYNSKAQEISQEINYTGPLVAK